MKNKRNRQEEIVRLLEGERYSTIDELCVKLRSSYSTIRRDLEEMLVGGRVRRIQAGAYYLDKAGATEADERIPFLAEKRRIADAAAALIKDGDTIFMDGGTTNLQIADKIIDFSNITVVTNSIDIAYKLRNRKNVSMYICGGSKGEARPGANIVGPLAEKMVSLFRAQICFLSTFGIHASEGVTDPDLSAARMKTIMIENASKTVMVTDHSKFGIVNSAFVCPVTEFDRIITDCGAPEEDVRLLQSQGVHVELV